MPPIVWYIVGWGTDVVTEILAGLVVAVLSPGPAGGLEPPPEAILEPPPATVRDVRPRVGLKYPDPPLQPIPDLPMPIFILPEPAEAAPVTQHVPLTDSQFHDFLLRQADPD